MESFSTRGECLAARFDEIARHFKSHASKAIKGKRELLARCTKELRESILPTHGAKFQAIAAGNPEPRGRCQECMSQL